MTDLSPLEPAGLSIDAVRVTETAWEPQRPLEYDEWEATGQTLQRVARASSWWLADWVTYGETHFPDVWEQAMDLTGLELKTLQVILDVGQRIPPERRRETLSWSHHRAVAYLDDPEEQDRYLDEAEAEGLTVARLKARVQGRPEPEPPALTDGVQWRTTIVLLHGGMNEDDARERGAAFAGLAARRGAQVARQQTEPADSSQT